MNNKADVIIIGAGVIGCAAAYYLRKLGFDVLVLEKNMIGYGGSSRNGGGVRQSARDVRELQLAIYSINNMWPYLNDELNTNIEYHKNGNLRLAKTPAHIETLKKQVAGSTKAGLDVRMMNGDEARAICPYMSKEVIGASWCPTDGHANPMITTLAYYKNARRLGARFLTGTTVKSLCTYQGKIRYAITDDGSEFAADNIILAAGIWSKKIAESVGLFLPIIPHQLEALVTEIEPKMFGQMLGTAEADFYGHQAENGSFVFGGSSGMEQAIMPQSSFKNISITAPSVCRGILKYFPSLADAKIIRTWSGWGDMAVDAVPIISEVNELPGLTLACGFTGHGFGISPAVGLTLSEIIAGKKTTVDITALHYNRFKAKDLKVS